MRATHPASDPGYPPAGYCWPLDLATHLRATLRGAERRNDVQVLSFPAWAAEARHA